MKAYFKRIFLTWPMDLSVLIKNNYEGGRIRPNKNHNINDNQKTFHCVDCSLNGYDGYVTYNGNICMEPESVIFIRLLGGFLY
jgi:hypothetical protein